MVLLGAEIASSEAELDRYLKLIKQLSSNPGGALQPDIFAEYFLLQETEHQTGGYTRSFKKSLLTAQQLSSQNTYAFISRCAVDYPAEIIPFKWWNHLFEQAVKEEGDNEILEELTASQLTLHGHRHIILDNWLPPLCEIGKSNVKSMGNKP